jgi:hypothetical protein
MKEKGRRRASTGEKVGGVKKKREIDHYHAADKGKL